MSNKLKPTDGEFNRVGQFFVEYENERFSYPIPFSTFQDLGWNAETYIGYLNCVDALRSSLILIRLKGDNLQSNTINGTIFMTAAENFTDFIKQYAGVCIDAMQLLRSVAFFNSVYYSNSQYYDCKNSFLPFNLPDIWDELRTTSPQVFLHISPDYFRGIIELLISRAARQEQLIPVEYGDEGRNRRKLEYSSYASINKEILTLQKDQAYSRIHELSATELSSMDTLWSSAETAADYWYRVQENNERLEELEEFLEEWLVEPWFSSKKGILYVCRGMVKCLRDNHTVKSITGIIPSRSGQPVEINMNYCVECDKFFITEKDFEYYRKKFGLLAAHFTFESSDDIASPYNELAEQSPLKLCGYSVSSAEGYTAEERQGLLSAIIDNEIMSKTDVLSYLNWFVQYNGSKSGNEIAVGKWNEDIKFVRDYHIGEQPHCYISTVKQWGK